MRFRLLPFLLVSILLIIIRTEQCLALVAENGTCSLFVYLPFTYNGKDVSFQAYGLEDTTWPTWINSTWGFNHMAAALLAVEHFNNRNSSVFSTLGSDCPVRLEPTFLDAQVIGHAAARSFAQQVEKGNVPCAIAGPFSDQPALELSTLAVAHQIPLVAYRAFNNRIASQEINPFSSQVFPDLEASSEALVSFLLYANRSNYISFVYAANDAGTQRREAVTLLLDQNQMRWFAEPYQVPPNYDFQVLYENTKRALQKVKDQGYRTIVVSLDDPVTKQLAPLSLAAQELGMTTGDYFWVWLGSIEVYHFLQNRHEHQDSIDQLLWGSVWVASGEKYYMHPNEPFIVSWRQQAHTRFVDRLNEANPIAPGEPGYVFAPPDFFTKVFPDWGSGLVADAVLSIGYGACLAAQKATLRSNSSSTTSTALVSGEAHLQNIRNASFRGASADEVRFSPDSIDRPGTRDPATVYWAYMNFQYAKEDGSPSQQLKMRIIGTRAGFGAWGSVVPIVYGNGSHVPPDLRDLPEQNYLSPGLQAFGLALMTIAFLLGFITIIWVYLHRKHPVLLAAQPPFLYLISLGSILFAMDIFTFSFDERTWSEDQLTRACMASPWLYGVGYMTIYGALFSKLWRVNRVLQFHRRVVGFYRAVLPFGILLVLTVISLSLTTALNPPQWEREVIDEDTGESMGRCTVGTDGLVTLLMIIMTLMTVVYAWRTRDVDSAYSESSWIFMLILLQVQLLILAIPVLILLEKLSTDGYYFGMVIMSWIFPMTTLLLIMGPKVAAHYKAVRPDGRAGQHQARGSGGQGRIQVSGVLGSSGGMTGNGSVSASASTQVIELTGPELRKAIQDSGRASPTQPTVHEEEAPRSQT